MCTFTIISRRILLRMRKISYKSYRENQNTHFINNNFFLKLVTFMRSWKNVVNQDRPQMTMCMCIAYWITKATDPDQNM